MMNVKQLTRFEARARELQEKTKRLINESKGHSRKAYNEAYDAAIEWLRKKPDADIPEEAAAIQIDQGSPTSILRRIDVNVSNHPAHPDRRPVIIESRPQPGETWLIFPHGVATVVHESGACSRIPGILAVIQ